MFNPLAKLRALFGGNGPIQSEREPLALRASLAQRYGRYGYDASLWTQENSKHWTFANGLSADALNSPEVRRTLRNRARYEVANNCYARGIINTLANDVIGTGPRLQMLLKDSQQNKAIEKAWRRWAEAIDLAAKLRTLRQTRSESGEGFALKITNGRMEPVTLDLKLVEADQVTTPEMFLPDSTHIDGITFDRADNPLSYKVLRRHPGDYGWLSYWEYDEIPADQVLHYFRMDRPRQRRGIPEITPALPLFAQLRRYTLAVLAAAETAADHAAILQSDAPPNGEVEDLLPMDTFELERNMMTVVPNGWKLGQFDAKQPTTAYAEFKKEILNEIARCLNVPYNVAAGNSSGYNYSSGRLDHQVYFRMIRIDQVEMERVVLNALLKSFLDEAMLVPGLLPPLPPVVEWPHQWFWDGQDHVDPSKEANAQAVRLQNNTTTLADEWARRGHDWEPKLRQRAKEIALCQQLGVPWQAAMPGTPPAEEDDDETPPKKQPAGQSAPDDDDVDYSES